MRSINFLICALLACTLQISAAPSENEHAVGNFLERRSQKAVKTQTVASTKKTTKKTSKKTTKDAKKSSKKTDSSKAASTKSTKKSSKKTSKSKTVVKGSDAASAKSAKTTTSKSKIAPTVQSCKPESLSLGTNTKVIPYYQYKSSSAGQYDIVDLSGGAAKTFYSLSSQGLEMKLFKPTSGSKLGRGMTFNTTFLFQYGTVSFDMKAAGIPGTVTAGIILAPGGDEVDIEITGKDKKQYETNIYLGGHPVFGVFGAKDALDSATTQWHSYSIKRTPTMIQWSVDGKLSRTLTNGANSTYEGVNHYPYHPGYLQFGIWDASYPAGTASWAGGPIKWSSIKSGEISAYVRNLKVTC